MLLPLADSPAARGAAACQQLWPSSLENTPAWVAGSCSVLAPAERHMTQLVGDARIVHQAPPACVGNNMALQANDMHQNCRRCFAKQTLTSVLAKSGNHDFAAYSYNLKQSTLASMQILSNYAGG